MFFDFSSAFNTIQPALLRDKLENTGVDYHLAYWILDDLTERPQYVRTRDCVSDVAVCSTRAPQGTVLAPFLFTLFTTDFSYNTTTCHLQKFSDGSAIVGLISNGDDKEYRELMQDLVEASGTASRSTRGKLKSWWWISAGDHSAPRHQWPSREQTSRWRQSYK